MKQPAFHRIVALLACAVGMSAGAGLAEAAPCGDDPLGQVSATGGSVRVTAPSVPELESNDVLLQLNSHRLRVCDDLERAIEEARAGGLDVLLLVERGGQVRTVRVELPARARIVGAAPIAASADVVLAEAPTRSPVAPPTPTRPATASPTASGSTAVPTPLSDADAAMVREAIAEANAFGHEVQDSLPLPSSQPWLGRLQRLLDAQAQRRARSEAVAALQPIFSYYETVGEILVYKDQAPRDASRRRRGVELILEYDSGSTDVNGWLKRYPFLAESVIEPPEEINIIMRGERPGRWLPNRAIELLVERALSEARVTDG